MYLSGGLACSKGEEKSNNSKKIKAECSHVRIRPGSQRTSDRKALWSEKNNKFQNTTISGQCQQKNLSRMACAALKSLVQCNCTLEFKFALDVDPPGDIGEFIDGDAQRYLKDLVKEVIAQRDVEILCQVDYDLLPFDPAESLVS